MSNAFEDAMHQGFSRADMAQELMELEKRMHGLGCDTCQHQCENAPTCNTIINHPEKFFSCGFYCENEELERDYASNMPCDNYGYCGGMSCPMYFKCKGGTT